MAEYVRLVEDDHHDPLYLTFDHRTPRDEDDVVVCAALINDMKSDTSEAEFREVIRQLASRFSGGDFDERVLRLDHHRREVQPPEGNGGNAGCTSPLFFSSAFGCSMRWRPGGSRVRRRQGRPLSALVFRHYEGISAEEIATVKRVLARVRRNYERSAPEG